jgi:hypothetical protein
MNNNMKFRNLEVIETNGGRDRSRTCDLLRVKERHHFQTLRRLRLIPIFTTTWGICFSLKRNPSRVNESSFGTVLPQYDLTVSTNRSLLEDRHIATHIAGTVPFCAIQVMPGSGTPDNCCGFNTLI